jgi:hypothetical protein
MFGSSRSPIRRRPHLLLEELESRTLLSASVLDTLAATPLAVLPPTSAANVSITPQQKPGGGGGGGVTNPTPVGYEPSQIQTAYGFNKITFSNGTSTIKGDGSGQTIAIVDAYNDPNIQSDLAAFDKQFGLPTANLKVAMPEGKPLTNSGWAGEISLDVEWAHAMAPGANLLLVEANNNSLNNLLNAVQYAANQPGVSVVSTSWGSSEFSSETAYDSYFTHPGVTFVASSGDQGAPTSWPAVSPNVVAVGGTSLTTDSAGNYVSETGWSGSGGGISAYESKPTYQNSVTQSSTQRTNPDVAYNAASNSGYAIYDTVPYYGQTGWFDVYGTSAGAPQWSALVAIADQGRQLANNNTPNPLSGASQTLPALYNMAASDFHDITSGTSTGTPNYTAGPGYDLVTGRGTPYANLVVQALVSANSTGGVATGMVLPSGSGTSTATMGSPAMAWAAGTSAESVSPSLGGHAAAVATATDLASSAAPTQPLAASAFGLSPSSLSSIAFSAGQTPMAIPGVNSANQTPTLSAMTLGWSLYAPGPKSVSTPSANFGDSLNRLLLSESADDAENLGADGPQTPRQAISVLGERDSDLNGLPVVPAEGRREEPAACDAFFMDEAGMALLAEETLAPTVGDNEESTEYRGLGLALLGTLASSFWMAPDAAKEARRRAHLPLFSR